MPAAFGRKTVAGHLGSWDSTGQAIGHRNRHPCSADWNQLDHLAC